TPKLLPHHQCRHARRARGGATAGTADAGSAPWRPAAEGGQMTRNLMLHISERWFTLLQRLYPPDFRDEMGNALVEAYMDRAREALKPGGPIRLVPLWLHALVDSLRNGPAERARPAASWRRAGNWGRDVELVRRRLVRSPIFAATTIGTLT